MFRTIIAVGLVLGLVGAAQQAQAGVLISPAIDTGDGDNVNCRFVSLRDVTDATIKIRNGNGTVTATQGPSQLSAGLTISLTDSSPPSVSTCIIEGKGVSKGRTRVSLCVRDANNTPIECVTAP